MRLIENIENSRYDCMLEIKMSANLACAADFYYFFPLHAWYSTPKSVPAFIATHRKKSFVFAPFPQSSHFSNPGTRIL